MAQSPLGKSSEVTCPDGKTMCCIVDPTWKPAADTPATPAKKPPAEYKLTNPLGTTSIPVILGRIIKTFLGIVGALALAVFVYGGLMWMTARGDASQVKKGQDALKNATIGLFLIMFSYTLTASIATFLTSEQKEIAAQEGRGTTESETVKGGDVATLQGQLDAGKDAVVQGQGAAAAAGAEAGISTPGPAAAIDMCKKSYPENSIDFVKCVEGATGQQGLGEAVVAGGVVAGWLGTGQSTYNTPTPNAGQTGGQKDCKYAEDPDKCSTIGWKTVCNQKVFDTGYGTYNNLGCYSPGDCQPGTVLSDDCVQAVAIITSAVTSIPGLNLGGCMTSVVGVGKECQKSNQLCCKKK